MPDVRFAIDGRTLDVSEATGGSTVTTRRARRTGKAPILALFLRTPAPGPTPRPKRSGMTLFRSRRRRVFPHARSSLSALATGDRRMMSQGYPPDDGEDGGGG